MAGDLAGRIVQASILTGFLGSGKTTVLRHLLTHPGMDRTAVIINEFGEVGLDQHLVGRLAGAQAVLLENGCLCCTLIDDLTTTLRALYVRQAAGEIPAFDRIVIETTGLADPTTPIHTLAKDQLLADCYRLDGVITTVDGVNGSETLDRYREAGKQVAMADRILLTKTDIAEPEGQERLKERIRTLNPAATISPILDGHIDPGAFFGAGFYDADAGRADVRRWLSPDSYPADTEPKQIVAHEAHHHAPSHKDHFQSFCLTFDRPLAWKDAASWLKTIVVQHGSKILRIKGLLDIAAKPGPIVIHGVQRLIHPPVMLDAWPDGDHRSRIVFIGHDIEPDEIERLLIRTES